VIEAANPHVPHTGTLTDAEWKRVLRGRPFAILAKPEQIEWAHARGVAPVRCISCAHAPGETHDPWAGFCLEHRVAVSNTFPKLCREYQGREA